MARNPNAGGKGPKVSSQTKGKGPITGNWSLNQGSNGSSKSKNATRQPGASPSKERSGGWYLGSSKRK